jgi:hypothetical protein
LIILFTTRFESLQRIIDVPKAIETLKEDLYSMEMALGSLQAIEDIE